MALGIRREGSRATEVLLYRTSRLQVRLRCRTARPGISRVPILTAVNDAQIQYYWGGIVP